MKTINISVTFFFIFLFVTSAHPFESELWPEEGRPSFRALKDLRIHQSPYLSSPLVKNFKIIKGQKIIFQKTIFRTVKPSQIKVVSPVKIIGQPYGPIKYLSEQEYYSTSIPEKVFSFDSGDTFECMQYRAEGQYLVRIKGEIVGLDLTEELNLESEPETEWWVNVVDISGKSIGWLLIEEKNVEFRDRELG